jgi:hypothetical protein
LIQRIAVNTLQYLEKQIQSIYEVDIPHAVHDFLITDKASARLLDCDMQSRDMREKLLVHQDEDNLNLSLYIAADIVEHLRLDDPVSQLHDGNIGDFCLAVEGISHFIYLIWNATYNRSVTLLEMELQAEIDKYVVLYSILTKQISDIEPGDLRRWLFDATKYDNSLNAMELQRYRDANYFAGKYCLHLETRFINAASYSHMINELRRFYRYTQVEKLTHINRRY